MAVTTAGHLLVVGGGIAGLAAALACARARPGLAITLLEQAPVFSEVGAGIQLGPNAVRVLHDWGLQGPLAAVAAFPQGLQVRSAQTGRRLGTLPLGARAQARYRAPYATVHRADVHALLLDAVRQTGQVALHTGQSVHDVTADALGVAVTTADGRRWTADVLLAADGLWSRTRACLVADGPPAFAGDLAYRALVPMADLPEHLRRDEVVAWLGPRLHGVQYPVRAGAWLNLVVVIEGPLPAADAESWDHAAHAHALRTALGPVHADLDAVLGAAPHWRLWPLHARPPMRGPAEHARGRVAWLGDAAHPMLPYLAQGAAMALEDAWALGRLLSATPLSGPDWTALLARWAQHRWARNARVQARARRNGTVFHARGPLRWGRDLALAVLGDRLLDQPWLYDGPPDPLASDAA